MRLTTLLFLAWAVTLASAACPLLYIQIGNDCYKAYQTTKSFAAAEDICAKDGGHLASIHSSTDLSAIYAAFPDKYLVGLKCSADTCDISGCTWIDGTPPDFNAKYDCSTPDAQCYYLGSNTFEYKTSCDVPATKGFLCKVPPTNQCSGLEYHPYRESCISARTDLRTFDDADDDCSIDGGHLASVHNDELNTAYQQLAEDKGITGSFWIGIKNNGTTWTDNTNVDYTNFAPVFPNPEIGDCTQVSISSGLAASGQWFSYPCDQTMPYVCVKPITQKLTCPTLQLFEHDGTAYSPGFPDSIPSRLNCEYIFSGATGSKMSLCFPHFTTDSGTTVNIFDGIVSTTPGLTLSGTHTDKPCFNGTQNVIVMKFASSTTPVGKGWQADYKQISNTPQATTPKPTSTTHAATQLSTVEATTPSKPVTAPPSTVGPTTADTSTTI